MICRGSFALLLGCLVVSGAGCGDECSPNDFGGGSACSEDGHSIQSCQFIDCFEAPCVERWVIRETACSTHLPQCVDVSPGETTCVGEVVGTCSMAGLVGCEDAFTQLTCAHDGNGDLRLMRGPCGPGAQCVPPGSGIYDSGCQK